MKSTRGFLIAYAIVYIGGGVILNAILGPPGYSAEYMEANKDAHDHYLTITKDADYRKWVQQGKPANEELEADDAFIQEYESNEEFQSESTRRAWYDGIFDVFNSIMLVVLAARFGTKPLLGFIDKQIAEIESDIRGAEESKEAAAARKAENESKIATLGDEEADAKAEAEKLGKEELANIAERTQEGVALIERERDDRLNQEKLAARNAMKAALVDEAIAQLEAKIRDEADDAKHAALVDIFINDLEQTKL